MGIGMSVDTPVKSHPDSWVAVSIVMRSNIRVMNATPEVKAMFERLDQEMINKWGSSRKPMVTDYYGTVKLSVGTYGTFSAGSGKDPGTLGKIFAIRCIEEMYKLGYNFALSTDLARRSDHATWYFAKSKAPGGEDRSNVRLCCIATGGRTCDKLVLLRHDDHIKEAVNLAIQDCWTKGIKDTEDIISIGETLHEIQLHGMWGHTHDDGINTRKLICNMVGRMGGLNWRLIASTNLKGTADSYFFIYDPTFTAHPNDFCIISLSKQDRLRLINCNELAEPLKAAVTAAGQSVEEELDYYGCYEVRLGGTPWWSSDHEAIRARRTISRVLEMMCKNSWTPYTAIDVSRSLTDKTSFLFRRAPFPANVQYACLALTDVNRIRLLDFPLDVGVPMRNAIYENYPFGIASEVQLPDTNLELNLNDYPWMAMQKGCSGYHAKAMLGRMMKIGEDFGWYPALAGDVSAKFVSRDNDRYSVDVHSIYFVKMN